MRATQTSLVSLRFKGGTQLRQRKRSPCVEQSWLCPARDRQSHGDASAVKTVAPPRLGSQANGRKYFPPGFSRIHEPAPAAIAPESVA